MAQVRRYGPSSVRTEVSPPVQPGPGRAVAFEQIRRGFEAADQFIAPAVQREQKQLGEEEALKAINDGTFEPKQPFTFRSKAFNAAADRIITTETMLTLDEQMADAVKRANGNSKTMAAEIERIRGEVGGRLPALDGLRVDFEEAFMRSSRVATRRTEAIAERRAIAAQRRAAAQALANAKSAAVNFALMGATGEDMAGQLSVLQDQIAEFGPRGEFTMNGKTYPADPKRAGMVSAKDAEAQLGSIFREASRVRLEADFQLSESPSEYVAEFRDQVFSGNSPLAPAESLKLLNTMTGRAYTAESRRRQAEAAAAAELEAAVEDSISPYVQATEAGVPVAIPEERRVEVLESVAGNPELARRARTEFAIADAAIDTAGMTGPELLAYVENQRGILARSVELGGFDQESLAVLNSLSDRVAKISSSVTERSIGLPLIDEALSEGQAPAVDYDALRSQAAGNEAVIEAINETEAVDRAQDDLGPMTATRRDAYLQQLRDQQTALVARGQDFAGEAMQAAAVLDRLGEWSARRQDLAQTDSLAFARMANLDVPSMEGVETLNDVGAVLVQRVAALSGPVRAEGGTTVTPIAPEEAALIGEAFVAAPRSQRLAFVASIASTGEEQAVAILDQIGAAQPDLVAAGKVYIGGNTQAADIMMRAGPDVKIPGGGPLIVADARSDALGRVLRADMIDPASLQDLDRAAMQYARGMAIANGSPEILQDDLETGYLVAAGRQSDGTGGPQRTSYGPTILPAGWDDGRLEEALDGLTEERLFEINGGLAMDAFERIFTTVTLRSDVAQLRPVPGRDGVYIPLDEGGGAWRLSNGLPLTIDLGDFE